jgi:hypothetical protein
MNRKPAKRSFVVRRETITDEKRTRNRAIFLGFLTLLLIIVLALWGVPFLIRFASFLGDIKTENEPVVADDTIPPLPPQFSFVPEATNSSILVISGFAEQGADVEVYFNDELLTETRADENGEFQIEKISLNIGKNDLFALATDEAGNLSDKSKVLEVIYDNEPPNLDIQYPEDGLTVYEQQLEIRGVTEPEAKVTINDYLVMTESDGIFSHIVDLSEGDNQIVIVSEDIAGNKTEKTLTVNYHL